MCQATPDSPLFGNIKSGDPPCRQNDHDKGISPEKRIILYYWKSASLIGSPQLGQNFGIAFVMSGSKPHLSHFIFLGADGFGLPQFAQNLPPLLVPQSGHVHAPLSCGAGFGLPQFAQNLPVLLVPHPHVQPSAAGAA